MLYNENGVFPHLQMGVCVMGFVLLWLAKLIKVHFLPHLESFMQKRIFEINFFEKILYIPLMGCSQFANLCFQMGATLMGFADHFGHCLQNKPL